MAPSDPFQLVGQTIAGKYRLDRVIGEGGFGVVYGGMHLALGEPIALKCLKPMEGTDSHAGGDGFLREARVLFSLTHPAIVRMYDVGTISTAVGQVPYVVLELVVGVSLEQEIARRRELCLPGFSAAEVLAVFDPVLDGLAFAHKKGIAHRDLKPSNVMLVAGENGAMSAKLLDFGTARTTGSKLTQMAATSATGFTPRYAAPEQWDPSYGTTGPGSDIFSLGLILAEVCTLLPMLAGESATEILAQVMNTERFVSVSASRYDLSPEIDRIVLRATRVALPERFASVREMADALKATLSRVPSFHSGPMMAIAPPQAPPRLPVYYPPTYAATTAHPMTRTLPRPSGTSGWVVLLSIFGGIAFAVVAFVVIAIAVADDDAPTKGNARDQPRAVADAGALAPPDDDPPPVSTTKPNAPLVPPKPTSLQHPTPTPHVTTARIELVTGSTAASSEQRKAELRTVVEATFDIVEDCYGDALDEDGTAQGEVELTVEVAPTGRVTSALLTRSDIKDTTFHECATGVARTWKFPDRSKEFGDPTKFKYVLKLRS
ncbi:MAG: Serine/threonine kinase [Myxococcaceae bacterium]|nr:Serine/threonine kinase [Myxococcaceae bacterium]